MKITIFSHPNVLLYSLIVFLSVLVTSCGSYQNSSYYDSDGIYGNTVAKNAQKVAQDNSSNYYKDYFNSLQNDNIPTEIFTDVDNYSDYKTPNDTLQRSNQDYADWGNNSGKTTINVYTNPNPWSVSLGFGWGFPSYGWGYDYGWGYPYYGWGYSSFGWNYPYYGWGYSGYGYSNTSYSHNPSRRGSSYSNPVSVNRSYGNRSYSQNNTDANRGTNYTNFRRNATDNTTRISPTFTRRNESQTQYNSDNTPTRSRANTNNSSSESYTPSRSYTPSYNSSSSPGSNSGSGRSSGGGRR